MKSKILTRLCLSFGLFVSVLTATVGTASAEVMTESTEESPEAEDKISQGNNTDEKLRKEFSTKDTSSSGSFGESQFNYYWYNNVRPNQKLENGKYYQTRYEYLDNMEAVKEDKKFDSLNKNEKEKLLSQKDKKTRKSHLHYDNVFSLYQANDGLLYMDDFGNIVIQTESTDRNTNSFYRTIGYTFSRIKSSGVKNLNSKKISKRKEVPADKSWLKVDDYNVDDASLRDWQSLYGYDPHYTSGGTRETFTLYLPSTMYEDNEKNYINWRRKNDGISATYIGPSASHKEHYEAQEDGGKVQPLAMGVYRKPQKVNGRRHSINTWVFASDDLFGKFSQLKKDNDYPQSKLYRKSGKNGDWYKEVMEAKKYNAAWFGVDAVIEIYSNGHLSNTATWRNPSAANVYANRSDQYNRYFRLGGHQGVNTETKVEREGMSLLKNKYKDNKQNIHPTNGFAATDAIPYSSKDKYTSPDIRTANLSNDFELGTAIPTDETYTNTIDCDTWYGSIRITRYTKKISIDISWTGTFQVPHTYVNSDGTSGTYYSSHSVSGGLDYDLSADSYAIADINLAQLGNAIIKEMKDDNSTWKTQYKSLNEIQVPIQYVIPERDDDGNYHPVCYSNENENDYDNYEGNIASNVDVVDKYYMPIPQEEYAAMINPSNYTFYLGTVSSYSAGSKACEKYARQLGDSYVNAFMSAWNKNIVSDTLYVNGAEYLKGTYETNKDSDGNWVTNGVRVSDDDNPRSYKFNGCYPSSDSGSADLNSHMVPNDKVNVPYVNAKTDDGTKAILNSKDYSLKYVPSGEWELPKQVWLLDADKTIVGDKIQDNTQLTTTSTVHIPKDAANGLYYTKIHTVYYAFGCIDKTPSKNKWTMSVDDLKLTDTEKDKYSGYPAIIKKLPSADKNAWTYTDDEGNTKTNDPQKNEAIHVHSPVITPVSIKGENKTQLINQDESVTYQGGAQLILDNTYKLTFDWDNYFKMKAKYVKGYDGNKDKDGKLINSAGWTKYLTEKRVRFPYSVEIKSYTTMDASDGTKEHTVEKYFEPTCGKNDTGSYMVEYSTYRSEVSESGNSYTPWIVFPNNTIAITIYIPAWADEGSYVSDDMYDNTNAYMLAQDRRCFQVEVRANNYSTEANKPGQEKINKNYKHHTATKNQGEGHNGTQENGGEETYEYYGATYEYPTEVSGIIYGFQIDAVSNPAVFTGKTKDEETGLDIDIANLVENKTEKKVGLKNRIGENVLRHTLDGSLVDTDVNTAQKTNTLPLTTGKSDVAKKNGYLQRGDTFSFEVKTIAGLEKTDDKISITPNFRYYTADGKSKNVALYYDNPGGSGDFIYYGDANDSDYKEDYLWSQYHRSCYYDYDKHMGKDSLDTTYWSSWHDFSSKFSGENGARDMARSYLMLTKQKCSRLNNIVLPAGLRLFTSNEEELRDNLKKSVTDTYRYTDRNETDEQSVLNSGDYCITKSEDEDLKDSMQTWYGTYTIPGSLRVVDVDKVKEECDKLGYTYDNNLTPLYNYLEAKGSIRPNEDIFINDGYLILNFDIKSYKDNGNYAHLQYYGDTDASLDMWNREDPDNSKIHIDTDDGNPIDVPKDPGDVTVIELKNNAKDRWTTGVIYAN